jgi:hypothetical protein
LIHLGILNFSCFQVLGCFQSIPARNPIALATCFVQAARLWTVKHPICWYMSGYQQFLNSFRCVGCLERCHRVGPLDHVAHSILQHDLAGAKMVEEEAVLHFDSDGNWKVVVQEAATKDCHCLRPGRRPFKCRAAQSEASQKTKQQTGAPSLTGAATNER